MEHPAFHLMEYMAIFNREGLLSCHTVYQVGQYMEYLPILRTGHLSIPHMGLQASRHTQDPCMEFQHIPHMGPHMEHQPTPHIECLLTLHMECPLTPFMECPLIPLMECPLTLHMEHQHTPHMQCLLTHLMDLLVTHHMEHLDTRLIELLVSHHTELDQ